MAHPLRLVFLGSDPIALPLLDYLGSGAEGFCEVVAVFTQPDRAVGRGQKVQFNAIKGWACARSLPVFQPEKLDDGVLCQLRDLKADVSMVFAYGHILKDPFIAAPRLGTLNLHTSLLPAYRGASPIQTAIACGETLTGVSLMRIVRALDAGPVADVERIAIGEDATGSDIEGQLARACVPLVARSLPRLQSGSLAFVEQDHGAATYCRRLAKEDGVIDFRKPANEIARRINGLNPWPGVSVGLGGTSLKFGRAVSLESDQAHEPGVVLEADTSALRIGTGKGILRVLEIQRPGGRMLPAVEFLRGFPVPAGTCLPSAEMPCLRSATPFRS